MVVDIEATGSAGPTAGDPEVVVPETPPTKPVVAEPERGVPLPTLTTSEPGGPKDSLGGADSGI